MTDLLDLGAAAIASAVRAGKKSALTWGGCDKAAALEYRNKANRMNDLVLKGGRVVDPSQGLDKVTDIAFANGKVAAIGDNLSGKDSRNVAGKIVSPGLIDLHTHVYWGGTSLGVEAELLARTGGVTTFIDAGSAGPGNFHGFRKHVIEPSPVRILPYLNIAFPGIFAFSKTVMVGENSDMGVGSRPLFSPEDYASAYQPGHFWTTLLEGDHGNSCCEWRRKSACRSTSARQRGSRQ